MIEGFIGRPGSGKSYSMTAYALEQAEQGRQVFVNYRLSHPNVYQFGPDDLLHLPPGLIVIDEAHLWFSARQALKLPPSWLQMLSQTRKKGWDLVWAAQHERRVDSVIKDVSNLLWLCKAWRLWSPDHADLFHASSYEPEYFRRKGHQQTAKWRLFSQTVADAYNTYESLVVAKHATDANDAYANSGKAPL